MVKLVNYIRDCLKDKEFREIWEEDNADLDPYLFGKNSIGESVKELTIREALKLLNGMTDSKLDSIITDKGIHPESNDLATTEIIFMRRGVVAL